MSEYMVSRYQHHAMNEFRAAGWLNEYNQFKDEMQGMICNHVLKLLEAFHNEGHSGFSANYAIDLFKKLASFEPIVPLTGEDWEWNEINDDRTNNITVYQNKRCSHVFKQSDRFDGKPYDIEGKIFWEWVRGEDGKPSKSFFTSSESAVLIEFPYMPKKEYVFRLSDQFPNESLIPMESYRSE